MPLVKICWASALAMSNPAVSAGSNSASCELECESPNHQNQSLPSAAISERPAPLQITHVAQYPASTIGFDTAINTVLDAIRRLRDTARSHNR